jgi:signal transduction histidine kinase
LKALAETLQDGALDDPAARRFLSQMEIEVDALSLMVQELLELSSIRQGPLQLKEVRPIDLLITAEERLHLQAERWFESGNPSLSRFTIGACRPTAWCR